MMLTYTKELSIISSIQSSYPVTNGAVNQYKRSAWLIQFKTFFRFSGLPICWTDQNNVKKETHAVQ